MGLPGQRGVEEARNGLYWGREECTWPAGSWPRLGLSPEHWGGEDIGGNHADGGGNVMLLMSGSTLPREVGDKVDGAQSRAAAHVQRPWERRRGKGEKLFSPSKRSLVALLEKVKHLSDNLAWMTRPGRLVLGSLADRRPDGRGCHGEGL